VELPDEGQGNNETKVAFVNPDDKIVEAAKLMQKYNVVQSPFVKKMIRW